MPGVEAVSSVTYLTTQVRRGDEDVRAMVVGVDPGMPGSPGQPGYLAEGRHITRSHYEAVADGASGFRLGDQIRVRRNTYTVVGITRRMVSSGGDPMVFIPLKDAQEAQFLKDNDSILQQRRRTEANPSLNRPGVPGILESVIASQGANQFVNSVLVRLLPGTDPESTAAHIRRWMRLEVYTREQMEDILLGKLISTSSRQIGMFLVILAIVSAAIVAFIIYTLTLGKIREIAVLKLIGTKNRTIVSMILQQAVGLGILGFMIGKISATFWAPFFPKFVLLQARDAVTGFVAVMVMCVLASILAIRAALKVDPADAIGG